MQKHIYDCLKSNKNNANFSPVKRPKISFRKNSLKRFQNVLIRKENDINAALAADLGKSTFEAFLTEYFVVMKELRTMIKNLEQWSQPRRISACFNFPSKDYLIPEPLVVL